MFAAQQGARPLLVTMSIEVQTYDIDFAGHVNNQGYVRWLEDLRMEMLRKYYPLDRLMEQAVAPILASTNIVYKPSIGLHDEPVGKIPVCFPILFVESVNRDRSVRLIPSNLGHPDPVVGTISRQDRHITFESFSAPFMGAWNLHPFRHGYPGFFFANFCHTKVSQSRAILWDQDLLRRAYDVKLVRIDPRNEERCPMTGYVVVVCPAARIDQKKRIAVADPMLLGVVISQIRSVIEGPLFWLAVRQAVVAD